MWKGSDLPAKTMVSFCLTSAVTSARPTPRLAPETADDQAPTPLEISDKLECDWNLPRYEVGIVDLAETQS